MIIYIYIYIVNRSVISVFYIRYGYLVVLSIQGAVRYVVSSRSNMVLFDAEGVELRATKKRPLVTCENQYFNRDT